MQRSSTSGLYQRMVAIFGMACVWPSIHNQILYPLTFAFPKEGMPSLYSHYILYALSLLVLAGILFILRPAARMRLFTSTPGMIACGACGILGIILLITCGFTTPVETILFAVGIVLYAVFVPIYFIFWNNKLARLSEKRIGFDLLLSYLVFCAITALRLAFGFHAWPFAIAYPTLSCILAFVALHSETQAQAYPLQQTGAASFLSRILIVETVFVYIASVSVWLLNRSDALFAYPPQHRVIMYMVTAAIVVFFATIFRPKSKLRSKANVIIFAVCTSLLVLGILASGLGTITSFDVGNFPLLTAKIAFELAIWVGIAVHVQIHHTGMVRPALFYLVFVIGGSNLVTTLLLYGNQLLLLDASSIPVLAVTIVSAFVILLAVNIVMLVMLSKQIDASRVPATPCEATINNMIAEEDALQQIASTFKLSQRETDTLRLAAQNKSAKEVAEELFVAESTVNSHLKSIYRKTDVHSRADLIALVKRFREQ